MLTFVRRHGGELIIGGGIVLALIGLATYPADARTTVQAMRLVVPRYSPSPASPTPVQRSYRCPWVYHAQGSTHICVAVHLGEDAVGNQTLRGAAAIASYDRRGRAVSRPMAVRVSIVGKPSTLRRAFPLETTRRTRRSGAVVNDGRTVQARATLMERRGHKWRKYLVYSVPVRVR